MTMAAQGGGANADDWQILCTNASERNAALQRAGLWTDCTLEAGAAREPLAAHRLLLAMASPVFAAMFYGAMQKPTVAIPDVQPEALKALLEYIYSDKVSLTSFELACDVYYAAQKYHMPHLANECHTYMCRNLTPNNACHAYEMGRLFDSTKLMADSMQVIKSKTKDVLNSDGFLELDSKTVAHILSTSEALNIDSELDLFKAVERYAHAQDKTNEIKSISSTSSNNTDPSTSRSNKDDGKSIRNVVEKIRFLSMTPQEFAEGPAQSALLTKDENLAILLNLTSKNISTPMPIGFSTTREKRHELALGPQRRPNSPDFYGCSNDYLRRPDGYRHYRSYDPRTGEHF